MWQSAIIIKIFMSQLYKRKIIFIYFIPFNMRLLPTDAVISNKLQKYLMTSGPMWNLNPFEILKDPSEIQYILRKWITSKMIHQFNGKGVYMRRHINKQRKLSLDLNILGYTSDLRHLWDHVEPWFDCYKIWDTTTTYLSVLLNLTH